VASVYHAEQMGLNAAGGLAVSPVNVGERIRQLRLDLRTGTSSKHVLMSTSRSLKEVSK